MNPRQLFQGSVNSATPLIIDVSNMDESVTVAVYPGAGDTCKVEFCNTLLGLSNPGAANWQAVSGLSAASAAAYAQPSAAFVALRLTRTAGTGTDVIEICA
jgi:hypothetical protein